jgi:hypothetical protein
MWLVRILLKRVPRLSELFGFLGDAKASEVLLTDRTREARFERERHREFER